MAEEGEGTAAAAAGEGTVGVEGTAEVGATVAVAAAAKEEGAEEAPLEGVTAGAEAATPRAEGAALVGAGRLPRVATVAAAAATTKGDWSTIDIRMDGGARKQW